MGLIECRFFSEALMLHTTLTVTLPDILASSSEEKVRFPVMYVLHGGTEDGSIWYRQTHLEKICQAKGFMAVSCDAMSSAYADMVHGGKYFTYITQEVPSFIESFFPASNKPEDRFIAGFSMGGQGALKAGFRYPERYAAVLAISGARDMITLFEKWERMENGPELSGVHNALGPIDKVRGSENDIVYLAKEAAEKKQKSPQLFLACGESDYAREQSVKYHQLLLDFGLAHIYYEAAGKHDYTFVENALNYALNHVLDIRQVIT